MLWDIPFIHKPSDSRDAFTGLAFCLLQNSVQIFFTLISLLSRVVNICFQVELWDKFINKKLTNLLSNRRQTHRPKWWIVVNWVSVLIWWRSSTSCEKILPSWSEKLKTRLLQFFCNHNFFFSTSRVFYGSKYVGDCV